MVYATSVVLTRNDIFYDFTVEQFHNYVMAGVVHHNTGKTIMGMAAVHEHGKLSRKKGGYGGKYRAIVLPPDHLVGKWCREIRETIPNATIVRFGPQGDAKVSTGRRKGKGLKALEEESKTRRSLRDTIALLAKGMRNGSRARWEKPDGPEFYVLGRNQAKWLSDWAGIADEQKGFRNVSGPITCSQGSAVNRANSVCSKPIVVKREPVKDERGYTKYDSKYNAITTPVISRVHTCPKCGAVARDQKGAPDQR
jgi:hypothetical protein